MAGSLYVYTHLSREIVEINIPALVYSTHIGDWPRATLLKGPTNLWPLIYSAAGVPTSLDPGTPWADVGTAYAGDGSTKSYTQAISDAAPAQFFRVMVNSAP